MEPSRAATVEAHLRSCPSCSRYARVVEQGVGEYRAAFAVEPSVDFIPRLQEQLLVVDLETRMYGRPESSVTSAGVVLALVLLIATAAWIPVLRSRTAAMQLPPIAAHAPGADVFYSLFRNPTLVVPAAPSYVQDGAVIFRHASLDMSAPRAAFAPASR